ncbi:protein of unknown function (plasmid) [Thermococcus nautili]|nr:protein of unknown function [Thermococcus nautili]
MFPEHDKEMMLMKKKEGRENIMKDYSDALLGD